MKKMQVWKGSRNMKPLEIKHRVIGRGEPLICVPVVEQDAQSVIREITYLSQSTADMIEWRVDAFRDFTDYNAIRSVFEAVAPLLGEKLFLYTFRTAHQGGMAQVKAEQLDDLHDLAAESGCVDLVDLEFFEEDRPLHKIKRLREMGVSVIASDAVSGSHEDAAGENVRRRSRYCKACGDAAEL
jgi:3-dehydroquinate dehydratase-1